MLFPIGDENRDRRTTPFVNYTLIAINVLVFVFLQGLGFKRSIYLRVFDGARQRSSTAATSRRPIGSWSIPSPDKESKFLVCNRH